MSSVGLSSSPAWLLASLLLLRWPVSWSSATVSRLSSAPASTTQYLARPWIALSAMFTSSSTSSSSKRSAFCLWKTSQLPSLYVERPNRFEGTELMILQACVAAFLSFFLVKLVPYWGLAVIGTTVAFFVPLVYTTNQELIDQHLKSASDVINAQTAQVQGVVQQQAEHVSSLTKQYAGDYTGKVQEMLRGKGAETAPTDNAKTQPEYVPKESAFPTAPVDEPVKVAEPEVPTVPEEEPLIAT